MDDQPFRPALAKPAERGRGKSRGQIAYEGWSQGLPGCEWANQTATQQRAWEASAAAVLAASPAPTPPSVDWERVGPKLVEALAEVRARAKVMRNAHKLVGPRAFENDPRGRKAWADDRYAEGKDLMKLIRPALAAAQPKSNGE